MKKIGFLRGMESSFPEALIAYIHDNFSEKHGVIADFIEIDAVADTDITDYHVIIDRISHEVPFYRSFLKWASLQGVFVINNPFWWSADDKFIDNVIADKAGVAVPKTVLLPNKDHMPNTQDSSYRNLKFPLSWQKVVDYVGFPAFLKPVDGGGWRGVTKVNSLDELWEAYNASGTDCMILQEGIEFEDYFRCYGIGRKYVHIMRYNPGAAPHERYSAVDPNPIPEAMHKRVERDVLALCTSLGYDMNTVEFAVRDGIPYAIDFMNPAPDADYNSVGHNNFVWIVENMSKYLLEVCSKPKKAPKANPRDLMKFYV